MALLDDLAEKLAAEAMAAAKAQDDTSVIDKVAKTLGDSSQTLEEAFLTVVRLQRAAERGHETLDAIIEGAKVDILDNPDL